MTYTEEEARQKWCPHRALEIAPVIASGHEGGNYKAATRCITSDCMMWVEEERLDPDKHPPGSMLHADDMRHYIKVGRCGLAK